MKTTKIILAGLIMLSCALDNVGADTFGTGANTFEIEFAPIGDPGNAPDLVGAPNPAGSVPYTYNMGVYEISWDMVTKANEEGDLAITLYDQSSRPDTPVVGASWNEAARFVNWLNTSQGFPAAYKFSTQPGDAAYFANENILLWQAGDPGYNPANPFRNRLAYYVLPTMDEWYKAAYYDPDFEEYWQYPTGSNFPPAPVKEGINAGTAVHSQPFGQFTADITQAGGASPYGVVGLGGNVYEWEETDADLVNDRSSAARGVRGGCWYDGEFHLSSKYRLTVVPTVKIHVIGFRVASIPEPGPLGDFNGNGVLDAEDIDMCTSGPLEGLMQCDLNDDGKVNLEDHRVWVKDLAHTWYGDANLDGEFNTGDFVQVFTEGKYETGQSAGWAQGDWNGDGIFDTGDFVKAFDDGGYEMGPRTDAQAVPEPKGALMLLLGALTGLRRRRTKAERERSHTYFF